MKRLTAVLFAAIMMMTAVFTGAAMADEKEDITGTWYIQSMVQDGVEMDASFLSSMGMSMILTLNEDGTAAMEMSGQEAQEGAWSLEDGIIDFGTEVPIILEDGKLVMSADGQSIVFSREQPEAEDVSL